MKSSNFIGFTKYERNRNLVEAVGDCIELPDCQGKVGIRLSLKVLDEVFPLIPPLADKKDITRVDPSSGSK